MVLLLQNPLLQTVDCCSRLQRLVPRWTIRNAVVMEENDTSENKLVRIVECAVIANRKRITSIRVLVERVFFLIKGWLVNHRRWSTGNQWAVPLDCQYEERNTSRMKNDHTPPSLVCISKSKINHHVANHF